MQTLPQSPLELTLPTEPLQIDDLPFLRELGSILDGTLTLERGLRGYRLKNPIDISLDKLLAIGEKGVAEYVVKSLISQRPMLIPWVLDNETVIALARYMLRSRSGSLMGFFGYSNTIHLYASRLKTNPDSIIADVKPDGIRVDPDRLQKHRGFLERCIAEMQDRDPPVSPGRISGYVRQIRTFYKTNGVEILKPQLPRIRVVRKDRAPTPAELQILIDMADIRGKVVVSCLALGGFREGTLAQLCYRHVREDLENHRIPLHVHVESEIVKGHYGDYDAFLGQEAADYLQLYFKARESGTQPQWRNSKQVEYIPPETLTDDSPLIRDACSPKPRPIGEKQIYDLVHNLYYKAGLLKRGKNGGYDLRPHSIRKFFRTQMTALGVNTDYTDYMMGHVVSTYHDIQSKGVEFIRDVYARAGLVIRTQSKLTKLEVMKEFARAQGLDPDRILNQQAFAEPMMTYIDPEERNRQNLQQLTKAVLQSLKQHLTPAPEVSNR